MEELNFSYQQLNQLVSKGKVESIERGIYHLPDTYIDDYFSLQYRFPSLEIALWLHGLSLTIPFEPVMTFPFGTNTKKLVSSQLSLESIMKSVLLDWSDRLDSLSQYMIWNEH